MSNVNPRIEDSDHSGKSVLAARDDAMLRRYYAQRAVEYERIYDKPERQNDLATLRRLLPEILSGRHILEIACGTGYWTQVINTSAASVLGTDVNDEVLNITRQKEFVGTEPVFRIADAYRLDGVQGTFTAGFAGFWWSHIPKRKLRGFLDVFHGRLAPGALVLFLDNNYVEGSSTPIARRDDEGNTFQERKLQDGSTHEVLKNFPTDVELRGALVGNNAEDVVILRLQYYWCLSYRLAARPTPDPE